MKMFNEIENFVKDYWLFKISNLSQTYHLHLCYRALKTNQIGSDKSVGHFKLQSCEESCDHHEFYKTFFIS